MTSDLDEATEVGRQFRVHARPVNDWRGPFLLSVTPRESEPCEVAEGSDDVGVGRLIVVLPR